MSRNDFHQLINLKELILAEQPSVGLAVAYQNRIIALVSKYNVALGLACLALVFVHSPQPGNPRKLRAWGGGGGGRLSNIVNLNCGIHFKMLGINFTYCTFKCFSR